MCLSQFWRGAMVAAALSASVLPVAGSMVVGGEAANKAAKQFGAGSGQAICLLDVGYENAFEVGSGTLIRVDAKTGKGLILTSAHALVKFGQTPNFIALSFAPNPVLNLHRLFATAFVSHPDYNHKTKEGPDLALVEFNLPKGFAAQPMLLPTAEGCTEVHKKKEFLFGGYGVFALAGATGETGETKEGLTWNESKDDGRVRRIGYRLAEYRSRDAALVPRDSFEGSNDLASLGELDNIKAERPFRFLPSDHELFKTFKDFHEVMPTPVDSGAPFFFYDGASNQFCIAGVFASILGTKDTETERPMVVANAIAMTPEVLKWIAGASTKTMTEVSCGQMDAVMIKVIYNMKYKLGLSEGQLMGL